MFIQNEKDLEDYICNNIEQFKEFLEYKYEDVEDIDINYGFEFIGRQINIGGQFIDLLFENRYPIMLKENTEFIRRNFIIVELKFRPITATDLHQISKYMNLLEEFKSITENEISVYGLLLGNDLDNTAQEIQMMLEDIVETDKIKFAKIKSDVLFETISYSHTDEFLEALKFDKRIYLNESK